MLHYKSLYRYVCLKKFSGGWWWWSQSDYSVCPRPLHQFIQECLSKKSFPVDGWVVLGGPKVIIVSVRVIYVRFSVFLVSGFWVFRFSGFWVFMVFRFFGQDRTQCFSDGTGRDAELDNMND